MRVSLPLLSLLALAACAPGVPESGAGGNNMYNATNTGIPGSGGPMGATSTTALTGAAPATGFDPARVGAAIDAAEGGTAAPAAVPQAVPLPQAGGDALSLNSTGYGTAQSDAALFDPNRPRGNAPTTITETTSEMTPSHSGISDEQDFAAVSARETIQSDADRIARNRAQYVVIQPTEVPQRPGNSGPNIVEYAIQTTNAPGQQLYSRSAIRLSSPEAACRRYGSTDQAQEAFLSAGGPQRDPKGLDPDGDGFACAWDPRPFRLQ